MKRIILLGLLSFSLFGAAQEKESKLTNFAFVVGDFEFKGKTLKSKTEYNHYNGIWKSRYILDDKVIEEDFKIIGENGSTTFHGLTLRSFNSKTNEWVMGFFDASNQLVI